ncbi:transcription factor bHLH162-like [Ipomoea triloba]|uniref:transcription factor bHLH162-like n=1 Tax=Ipomoea triloba TaxID=35885 RepID=UPI00125DD9AF|nr:transcription factor bHLH162-like [Ipomoea triloba]
MQPNCSSLPPPRPLRHLAEKHRRQQMKGLNRRLASLVPHEKSLEKSPAIDVLDHATNYIKQLENNVNELKARKDNLQLPVVMDVNESKRGESLEINIVCGLEKKMSATNSTVGLKIYHTILCKAFSPRIGMDTIRVQERLKNFICDLG